MGALFPRIESGVDGPPIPFGWTTIGAKRRAHRHLGAPLYPHRGIGVPAALTRRMRVKGDSWPPSGRLASLSLMVRPPYPNHETGVASWPSPLHDGDFVFGEAVEVVDEVATHFVRRRDWTLEARALLVIIGLVFRISSFCPESYLPGLSLNRVLG